MTASTFGFILTGICLNALAQLLLKAGANAIGSIHPTTENWLATGTTIATQGPVIAGLACYAMSVLV